MKKNSSKHKTVQADEAVAAVQRRRHAYWSALDELVKAANGPKTAADQGVVEMQRPVGEPEAPKRRIRTHALDLMFSKKQLSADLWAAGMRFRDDWELAQISPSSSVDLERLVNAHAPKKAAPASGWKPRAARLKVSWNDLRPSVLDAQDRLKKAEQAVGREAYHLLIAIAAEGRSQAEVAKGRKFGPRKQIGKKLRAALESLGEHYGLIVVGADRARKIRMMGARAEF